MVRTRIAPSPTGQDLHIGNLYTALFNLAVARKYKGKSISIAMHHQFKANPVFHQNVSSSKIGRYIYRNKNHSSIESQSS